jgi:hypothetical protein
MSPIKEMLNTALAGGSEGDATGGPDGVGLVGVELLQPASTLAHTTARHTDRILRE